MAYRPRPLATPGQPIGSPQWVQQQIRTGALPGPGNINWLPPGFPPPLPRRGLPLGMGEADDFRMRPEKMLPEFGGLPPGRPQGLPPGLGLPMGLPPVGVPILPPGTPPGLPMGTPPGLPMGTPQGLPIGSPQWVQQQISTGALPGPGLPPGMGMHRLGCRYYHRGHHRDYQWGHHRDYQWEHHRRLHKKLRSLDKLHI
jgi:hypothetical protein